MNICSQGLKIYIYVSIVQDPIGDSAQTDAAQICFFD